MNAPDYLSRLRQKNEEKNAPSPNCINPVKGFMRFVQFATSAKKVDFSEPLEAGAGEAASVSAWWCLHFPDREPAEAWTSPPVTHAAILERHPAAIAAEPFDQAEPKRACASCVHRPPRWLAIEAAPCGNPMAAGLSDLPGVIRYSRDQGATCPAWLATLPGDLERRILAMAERWGYSGDELAIALTGARSDPDGWRRVVNSDEREH